MHESEKWKWSRSVMSDSSDPMDCNLRGSPIHGIFQAKVLEWGAIAFSKCHLVLSKLLWLSQSYLFYSCSVWLQLQKSWWFLSESPFLILPVRPLSGALNPSIQLIFDTFIWRPQKYFRLFVSKSWSSFWASSLSKWYYLSIQLFMSETWVSSHSLPESNMLPNSPNSIS